MYLFLSTTYEKIRNVSTIGELTAIQKDINDPLYNVTQEDRAVLELALTKRLERFYN